MQRGSFQYPGSHGARPFEMDRPTSSSMHAAEVKVKEDARSMAMESYQEIELPCCEPLLSGRPRRSGIKHLTHPSQIRKRSLAVKGAGIRRWEEGGNVSVAMPTRKKKRKCEDQVDVFDHLATLHRKQRALMEMQGADQQEVPVSPQFGPTPCDYPSLHTSRSLSNYEGQHSAVYPEDEHGAVYPEDEHGAVYPKDEHGAVYPKDEHGAVYPKYCEDEHGAVYPEYYEDEHGAAYPEHHEDERGAAYPKAKRVLFASDYDRNETEEGEGSDFPFTAHRSPLVPQNVGEGSVASEPDARLDQTLEHKDILQAHSALVPELSASSHLDNARPPISHLDNAPSRPPSSHLDNAPSRPPSSLHPNMTRLLSPCLTAPLGTKVRPRLSALVHPGSELRPHLTVPVLRPYHPMPRPHPMKRPHHIIPVLRPHSTTTVQRPHPTLPVLKPHLTLPVPRPHANTAPVLRPHVTGGSGMRLPPNTSLADLPPSSTSRNPEPLDVRNFSILRYFPREE